VSGAPKNRPPERDLAPTIQKLRFRYAKRGRLRFSSHRDFQRALERALRRANIPMAYSAGFSPHPKISYTNSAPTGVASEAEYVEIGVTQICDPDQVRIELNAALPPGLDILEVVPAKGSDFANRLEASLWRSEIDAPQREVQEAVSALLAEEEVMVERLTKAGKRVFDARGAIISLTIDPDTAVDISPDRGAKESGAPESTGCVILTMVVRHTTPSVRPDDVLAALKQVGGLVPRKPVRVTRLAQGPLNPLEEVNCPIGDPFDPDRALA
jgi:radical SAM-linked protein